MTTPEVQFVAAPEDGADILFDFNDTMPGGAPAQIVSGSFNLGAPSVEGDPDGLGVQYGARTASWSLLIYGNRHAAMETQALLARTFMLRRRGWLRVKLDEFSAPVWLRTYTPTPAELDFTLIQPDSTEDAWLLEVEVAAEPFIRGERIELWSGTINNNPAAGTNPMGITLPAIVGDAPAPLRIDADFSSDRDFADVVWSCAAVPSGHTPIAWQIGTGDGWTVVNDTSAPVASAASGGSHRTISFATNPGMAPRIFGNAPSTPSPGKYRVFIRVGSAAGSFAFRLAYRTNNGLDVFAGSPVVTVDSQPGTWVNLGEFEFPFPRADVDAPVVSSVPSIRLDAQRLSGSATLVVDVFLLVPTDIAAVTTLEPWEKGEMLVTEFGAGGPVVATGDHQLWDGDSELTLRQSSSGMLDAISVPATNRGAFPVVRPGVDNRLTLIQQARTVVGGDNGDDLTASANVAVSYQPRWLWLGDV